MATVALPHWLQFLTLEVVAWQCHIAGLTTSYKARRSEWVWMNVEAGWCWKRPLCVCPKESQPFSRTLTLLKEKRILIHPELSTQSEIYKPSATHREMLTQNLLNAHKLSFSLRRKPFTLHSLTWLMATTNQQKKPQVMLLYTNNAHLASKTMTTMSHSNHST